MCSNLVAERSIALPCGCNAPAYRSGDLCDWKRVGGKQLNGCLVIDTGQCVVLHIIRDYLLRTLHQLSLNQLLLRNTRPVPVC